jgi:transcriptional regulator with XRE-family HTH domain
MTVSDLAKASGVSRRMLQGVEQGSRNPGLRNVFELAAALGVPPSELVRDAEGDPSPD